MMPAFLPGGAIPGVADPGVLGLKIITVMKGSAAPQKTKHS